MDKEIPILLKTPNREIKDLVEQAQVYLQAYKDTGDWGFLPTVTWCIERISNIHMREANYNVTKSKPN